MRRAPSAPRYKSRPIGSLGPLACFSLHPRKVITTGEGGMITVEDPEVAARLRRLRQHSMDVSDLARHGARDVVIEAYPERGWNARMTDMQAALGLCQLELLDEILAERRRLAERYTAAIAEMPGIEPPFEPDYAERTWQSYAVRLLPEAPLDRNELMRRLLADGVPTRRGVMASHEELAYADVDAVLPHTEAATRESMMLPLFPGLTDEQQDHVIACLAGAARRRRRMSVIAPSRFSTARRVARRAGLSGRRAKAEVPRLRTGPAHAGLAPTAWFIAPDWDKVAGGLRKQYRAVDVLNAAGLSAAIVHKRPGFACSWFDHETRDRGGRGCGRRPRVT